MERLVGVVSPAQLFEDPNPRRDEYIFGNNYGCRIYDMGGIPLGILPSDGRVPERALEQFDAFLLCGGHRIWPYHLQVVHHAVTAGKPVLGICLGMQVIHRYFQVIDYMEATGRQGDLFDILQEFRKIPGNELRCVTGHRMEHLRGQDDATKQTVHLVPGSHIHRLLKQDTIRAGSFHNFAIQNPPGRLTVSGMSDDGIIDVIEYGDKVLGVQFHPEIDRELLPIFEILFS